MAAKIAVITGASVGIGRSLALRLAQAGFEPLLVARRADKLKEVAGDVKAAGGNPHVLALDVTAKGAAEKILAAAKAAGDVEVLVNNAGKGTYDLFAETPVDDTLSMIDLNVRVLLEATRVFLPELIRRNRGFVLNVASTAGFQGIPRQAAYSASKAFVITFTEALAAELKGSGVSATALCPGPTETEFLDVAGFGKKGLTPPKMVMMSADEVAQIGVRAMLKRRPIAIAGTANKIGALSTRLAPRSVVTGISGFLFKPRK